MMCNILFFSSGNDSSLHVTSHASGFVSSRGTYPLDCGPNTIVERRRERKVAGAGVQCIDTVLCGVLSVVHQGVSTVVGGRGSGGSGNVCTRIFHVFLPFDSAGECSQLHLYYYYYYIFLHTNSCTQPTDQFNRNLFYPKYEIG